MGEIENRDLYNSDDEIADNAVDTDYQNEYLNQDLDLGEIKREKKEMNLLFKKIDAKK